MPGKKKKSGRERKSSGNNFFKVAVVAVAVYAGVSVVGLQLDVRQRQQELADIKAKCEVQRIENKEMELQLSRGDDADYVERTARERLNFVYPYEKVYINAAGS